MNLLCTGSSGFAGSHAVRYFLINTNFHLVLPVSYDHHGLSERLQRAVEGFSADRYTIVPQDLAQPFSSAVVESFGQPDYIVNFASNSHVDRSITDPAPFILNNISLMVNMLEFARSLPGLSAFLHINTDECFGPSIDHDHLESDPHIPSNPYSASKSCQHQIATSYWRTYGLPYIGTHTTNLFGPMQEKVKFTSLVIDKIRNDEPIEIHARQSADGWESGDRIYTPVINLADAVLFLLKRGYVTKYHGQPDSKPDVYNICGERKIKNDDWALEIGRLLGKEPEIKYIDYHSSRPGHDHSYGIDDSKILAEGWRAPMTTAEGLKELVEWELAHDNDD